MIIQDAKRIANFLDSDELVSLDVLSVVLDIDEPRIKQAFHYIRNNTHLFGDKTIVEHNFAYKLTGDPEEIEDYFSKLLVNNQTRINTAASVAKCALVNALRDYGAGSSEVEHAYKVVQRSLMLVSR